MHPRKGFLLGLALALATLCATAGLGGSQVGRAQTKHRRPNVVLVVVDDQRAREGTLGVMPDTRRWLKRHGTTFTRAFSTTPLCCPSRASIFTGRYAHNHGVFTNQGKPKFDHDYTLQAYLDDAGYRTALAGKFFNDWPLKQRPPHFDRWALFDGGYNNRTYNLQGEMRTVSTYSTRFLGTKTLDFLEAFERRDPKPWFVYVAPYAPHAPFIPSEAHEGSEVPGWNGNPAVFEKDRKDKPEYVRIRHETYKTWRKNRRKQLRTLKAVDTMMSRIQVALRRLDENCRTLVIYMSDNGYMWADHGLYDKGAPYTPSIRIPMLMRLPGQKRPKTNGSLVGNIDVAPTILDAAGLSTAPGHPMDGRSLLEADPERDRILTEYRNSGNIWTPPTWASIRTKRWQYVEYFRDGKRIFREYYNLKKDPWQLRNLLGDDDPASGPGTTRLKALSTRLQADRKCTGATCP